MRSLSPKLLGDFLARTILLTRQGHAQCFTVQDHNDVLYLVWRGLDVPEQRQAFYLVPVTDAVIGWLQRHLLSLAEVFAEEGFLFVRYHDGRAPELRPCLAKDLPDDFERPSPSETIDDPPNTPGRTCAAVYRLHARMHDAKYPLHGVLQRLRVESPAIQADPDFQDAERRLRQADEARERADNLFTAAHHALLAAYQRAGLLP